MGNAARANGRRREISFFPTTWFEIRKGDRVLSFSGTERTVIEVTNLGAKLAIAFRTLRTNGDVELETAQVNPLSTQGIKEVRRYDMNAPIESHDAPPVLDLPNAHSLTPSKWSEVRAGDIVVSHSGTRRLVLSINQTNSGPSFECFIRTAEGQVSTGTLATAPTSVNAVQQIIRFSSASLANAGGLLNQAVVANVETFLGRGDTGDRFMQVLFQESDVDATYEYSVFVQALVDLKRGLITNFVPSIDPSALKSLCAVEVHVPADMDQLMSLRGAEFNQLVPAAARAEILLSAAISNIMKGVALSVAVPAK